MSHSSTLLIDMGNSAVKWKLGGEPASMMNRAIYPQNLDETFFLALWQGLEVSEVVVSCVASDDHWQYCKQALSTICPQGVARITTRAQAAGVQIAYQLPKSLGVDRFSAMVAAFRQAENAVLVVDCGSAITLDIVDAKGAHRGGYILPGIRAMQQSLRQDTAAVQVELMENRAALLPGTSTHACVEAGIYHAAVSLLESVFHEQQKQHGQMDIFLTGGDAQRIQSLLSLRCRVEPALVLDGLEILAREKENQ